MRVLLLFAGLIFLASCASAPSKDNVPLQESDLLWTLDLPERGRGWEVFTSGGKVAVLGSFFDRERKHHIKVTFLDADTGEKGQEVSFDIARRALRSRVAQHGDLLVYWNTRQVEVLHPGNAQHLWRFDPNGRLITGLTATQEHIYLSLNNKTLVVLDLHTGDWVRGSLTEPHRYLKTVETDEGPLCIVTFPSKPNTENRIAAFEALGEGGASPQSALPEAKERWSRVLRTPPHALLGSANLVAGTVNERADRKIFDARTGKTLHSFVRKSQVHHRDLLAEDLLPPAPLREQMQPLLPVEGPWLWGFRFRQGFLLQVGELRLYDPADGAVLWTEHLPSLDTPRSVRYLRDMDALLWGAPDAIALFSAGEKKTLWTMRVPGERSSWSSIATDGRALYVVYDNGTRPSLEARRAPSESHP